MADEKMSAMSATGTLAGDDKIHILENPGGTPLNTTTSVDAFFSNTDQFWIPASSFKPQANDPAAGLTTREFGSNNQNIEVMEFDDVADASAYVTFRMPQNWNLGTVTVQYHWFREDDEATPESKTISFDFSAVSISNFVVLGSVSYGTPVTLADTSDSASAQEKLNISAFSTAITIQGTPADGDLINLRITDDVSDSTTSGSTYFVGLVIEYTKDARNATG